MPLCIFTGRHTFDERGVCACGLRGKASKFFIVPRGEGR